MTNLLTLKWCVFFKQFFLFCNYLWNFNRRDLKYLTLVSFIIFYTQWYFKNIWTNFKLLISTWYFYIVLVFHIGRVDKHLCISKNARKYNTRPHNSCFYNYSKILKINMHNVFIRIFSQNVAERNHGIQKLFSS